MLKNYRLKQYDGEHPGMYMYIAPFAMDRKVLREFDGYPIVTSDKHQWFLLFDNGDPIAFLSLEVQKKGVQINNTYVVPDYRGKGIHEELIKQALEWCKANGHKHIEVDCLETSLKAFQKFGLKVKKQYVKWNRLTLDL